MSKYLNANGLLRGLIQAGQACPFLDRCRMRVHTCPTEERPKPNHFSCAAARLHSAIAESTTVPAFRAKYGRIVEKDPEEEVSYHEDFELPKKPIEIIVDSNDE